MLSPPPPFESHFRNTFVLEYCGEVLDHKEFKTRVKKYASMKNIHYYFMALKNNEVRPLER
jgi:histone-lysine N-methyltransferase SETD2